MLFREAVSPLPEPTVARRIALVIGVMTASVTVASVVVFTTFARPSPLAREVPTLRIATVRQPVAAPAQPAELARARRELAAYALEAYPRWVVENVDRACPRHLLELNHLSSARP